MIQSMFVHDMTIKIFFELKVYILLTRPRTIPTMGAELFLNMHILWLQMWLL